MTTLGFNISYMYSGVLEIAETYQGMVGRVKQIIVAAMITGILLLYKHLIIFL